MPSKTHQSVNVKFSAQDYVLSKSLQNCNVVNFNFIVLSIFIASVLFSQPTCAQLISPVRGHFLVHTIRE